VLAGRSSSSGSEKSNSSSSIAPAAPFARPNLAVHVLSCGVDVHVGRASRSLGGRVALLISHVGGPRLGLLRSAAADVTPVAGPSLFTLRLANLHPSFPPTLNNTTLTPRYRLSLPQSHHLPLLSAHIGCSCTSPQALPAPPLVANMTRPRKDVKFQHAPRSASNGRARRPSQSMSEISENESHPASPTKNGAVAPPVCWSPLFSAPP
jgi:hypothetical protein